MKIRNKNLLKLAVSLTAVCLFLAGSGTAQAAELLGIHASVVDDTGDTSTILLINTSTGTSTFLADTLLSRVAGATDPTAVNSPSGPNGLAYDTLTGTAYFVSVPNSGGGPSILYSVAVDPPDGVAPVALGNPTGIATDADWYKGEYWYIATGTDDLYSISFNPGGTIAANTLESGAGLLAASGDHLVFGDIAIDENGKLYGDARRNPGGEIVFFSVDLEAPLPNYTQHQSDVSTTAVLQLAFSGEGTLFGQTGALTGEQNLYYVS